MRTDVQVTKVNYPTRHDCLPEQEVSSGSYTVRFARNPHELDRVLALRYEVFNLEMNEGLDVSHATGRDLDEYDEGCHHLMVLSRETGDVVGTYRMQTYEMAKRYRGFYSNTEFDLSALQDAFLDHAVELGRACVAREHRNGACRKHNLRLRLGAPLRAPSPASGNGPYVNSDHPAPRPRTPPS